jgi:hypothetical protein
MKKLILALIVAGSIPVIFQEAFEKNGNTQENTASMQVRRGKCPKCR